MAGGLDNLIVPDAKVCEQAYHDMHAFEPDFGRRDFEALKRVTHFPWE